MLSLLFGTTIFSLLSLTTATPLTPRQSGETIALGYRFVHDGAQFIAWEPSQTSGKAVCDNNV